MASTESLIIELDARTAKLDAKLKATDARLDKLGDSTKKADGSLKKFGNVAGAAGAAILKVGAAVIGLGSAIGAIALKAASSRKELESFARQAKTTTEEFQALSFATKQYGINADQIADISKDISDKVGEFSAAGTGAFQDYADVMKMTKEEARQTAIEFQSLSGEQVIGRMVSELEAAGASGAQVTFVLESMGNDLSKLAPLFANNSAELNKLKERFDNVNQSMNITSLQAEKLKEVSTSFDLVQASIGNSATAISATLAPVINDFFNDVIKVVPDATQAIIDFANSFLDAENITSQAGVIKEITDGKENILRLEKNIAKASEDAKNNNSTLVNTSELQSIGLTKLLEKEKQRLEELEAQLVLLKEQDKLADARRLERSEIGGLTPGQDDTADTGGSALGTGDEISAIADRFKAEEALLVEKLARELAIVGENSTLRLQLEQEFADNMQAIRDKADEAFLEETQTKDEQEIDALTERQARLQEFLDNKLISEKDYQEKLREIIGEYAPETLDPSLLEEKNQLELDMLNEKLDAQLLSHEEYFRALKALQDKNAKDKKANNDKEWKWSTSTVKKQMDDGTMLLTSLGGNSKKAHKIKQGLAASNAFMNTAEGVTDALATQNYTGAAFISATGAAQVAAILSSTPDGGGSAVPPAPAEAPQQEAQEPDTQDFDVSSFTEGEGNTVQRVTIEEGDLDDLASAIARQMRSA